MTLIPSWTERPQEVANLLNPAYCAILVNKICDGYLTETNEGMPYALAFIGMPLVIYTDFSTLLPKSSRTKFHIWLNQNPEVLAEFAPRARHLAPYLRESISFGLTHQALKITTGGSLLPEKLMKLKQWQESDDPRAAVKKALTVGKLLGQIKDQKSIFSMFGVRP